MNVRPIYIASYFLGVLAVLFLLMFVSSKGGKEGAVLKEDGVSMGEVLIKYPHYTSFFFVQRGHKWLG